MNSCSSDKNEVSQSLLDSCQHVSLPVWHTGPVGWTFTNKVSLSQSIFILTNSSILPDVSPLVHKQSLDLLQNVTCFVSNVFLYAASFM